jgi:hypothetical protein
VDLRNFSKPENVSRSRAYESSQREEASAVRDLIGNASPSFKRGNPMARALDWLETKLNPPAAPLQPATPREIAICTPGESHRADWEACFYGVLGTLSGAGWRVEPRPGYSTNVYGVRMVMTDDLLALGVPFEYVLWIDDDNHLTGPQALRMIEYLDQHPDVDGIVAWCWIKIKTPKQPEWIWIVSCGSFSENGINMTPMPFEKLFADTEVKPVEATGFPVFLMRYRVLQTLGSKAFRPVFDEDCALGFSGEDLAFCKAAKEAGFKFVVDPLLKVPHMKWRADEPDFVIHADPPEGFRQGDGIAVHLGHTGGVRSAAMREWLEANNGKPLHVTEQAYELMEGKKM